MEARAEQSERIRTWNPQSCPNVATALTMQAAERPDAAAIHYPAKSLGGLRREWRSATYAELEHLSDALARGLIRQGIGPGVRAALMVPPGIEFIALFFALFKARAVPVLIDPGIGPRHLKACLAKAAPEAFIGITRAQLARIALGWGKDSVDKLVTLGPRLGWGGTGYNALREGGGPKPLTEETAPDDIAAILFTSGSTGPPKGVLYRHRHFGAQVALLREAFGMKPGEVDLATFPPFALFDPALGMTTVIPDMDPTRPAKADPEKLVDAIRRFAVTTIFGSPALLNVLSRHTHDNDITLPNVKRVVSAGAAVPLDTVRRMARALPADALVHTPYGATECLPVASISHAEMDDDIAAMTRGGQGICVGRPVPPNQLRIIGISDLPVTDDDVEPLPDGISGEIMVHGPTTTDRYWANDEATEAAKWTDSAGDTWHRMGDVGYLDTRGRLWYCGRKSQRVDTGSVVLFADQQEAYFNTHPEVERTALVGIGPQGRQKPVLLVELPGRTGRKRRERIRFDLLQMARTHPATSMLEHVLFHPGFPVDIRHNAKIGREQLSRWASEQLK